MNSDNSNVSTQQDLTYRMIKEVHHLKSKSLSRVRTLSKKSTGIDINSFHINTLRNSIHSNEHYLSLFSSPVSSCNKLYHNSSNLFHFSSSTTLSPKVIKAKNIIKNKDILYEAMHRMNTYRGTNRAESLMEFIDKTHKIRKEKYCYYIQKGNLLKIQDKNENNLGLEELDYYKNSTSYELFKLFDNNRQLYQKYLVKEIDKESDKNEKLHERKLKILNEMQRIKKKINKLRSIIELNYKDKFFLLSVKNGTNVIDKFCNADRKECLNSISSIQNMTSIKVLSSTEKSQSKFISAKRLSQILESDIILFTEQKKVEKPYVIFKTVDEFKKCLNNISFNVAKPLIKFNQVQNEVTSLR